MTTLLGCIADDFTGATDLASFLVKQGFRTIQLNGVPEKNLELTDADAVVIALKSRTAPLDSAVSQSLEALKALQGLGCQQFYFKYCSTFDSTEAGNIGPVIDALLDQLEVNFTIACPALPVNGRSVYQGHLFVNGMLLNESGMQHHPLTPMKDPNLMRVLNKQVTGEVGLVPFEIVEQGSPAIQNAFHQLESEGKRYAIVDALNNEHLRNIGHATRNLKLITGGSGLSIHLVDNFIASGQFTKNPNASQLPEISGNTVILSGSCSTMTQKQVDQAKEKFKSFFLDPVQLVKDKNLVNDAIEWAIQSTEHGSVLIYTTSPPEKVKEAQHLIGTEKAGELLETGLAEIAKSLATSGIRKFVIAGGETSGAVVQALDVHKMQIGPEIAPGVPWTASLSNEPIALALKSGNFGSPDFFQEALEKLQ